MLSPSEGTAWFGTAPSRVYDVGKPKRKEFAILNKNKNTRKSIFHCRVFGRSYE